MKSECTLRCHASFRVCNSLQNIILYDGGNISVPCKNLECTEQFFSSIEVSHMCGKLRRRRMGMSKADGWFMGGG